MKYKLQLKKPKVSIGLSVNDLKLKLPQVYEDQYGAYYI